MADSTESRDACVSLKVVILYNHSAHIHIYKRCHSYLTSAYHNIYSWIVYGTAVSL